MEKVDYIIDIVMEQSQDWLKMNDHEKIEYLWKLCERLVKKIKEVEKELKIIEEKE